MSTDKVRENRLRRMAQRQGLQLVKSKRRDPHALEYGRYMVLDDEKAMVHGGEEVELITGGRPRGHIDWGPVDEALRSAGGFRIPISASSNVPGQPVPVGGTVRRIIPSWTLDDVEAFL